MTPEIATPTPDAASGPGPTGPSELPEAPGAPEAAAPGPEQAGGAQGAGDYDLGGYAPPEHLADPRAVSQMTRVMREAGVTDAQARKLIEAYFGMRGEQLKALGVHGSPEDLAIPPDASGYHYDLRGIAGAAEVVDEETVAAMGDVFARVGITRGQASELVSAFVARSARMTQQAGDPALSQQALSREWGDSTTQNLREANRVFCEVFGEESGSIAGLRLSDGSKLGNHPDLIRAFHRLSRAVPAGTVSALAPAPRQPPAADAARGGNSRAEIARLQADPAYLDRSHPRHAQVVTRMNLLYGEVHGEEAAR